MTLRKKRSFKFRALGFVWDVFTAHDSDFGERFCTQYSSKLPLGAVAVQCYASSLTRPELA